MDLPSLAGFPELGLYALGFAFSATLGIIGGDSFFFDSKYFSLLEYSATNFAGLYAYTVLLPLAFIFFFMMSLMVYKMRSIPRIVKLSYFALVVALGTTAVVKAYITYDVGALLDCGVFCFSAQQDDWSTGKYGIIFTQGLTLVMVMLPLVGLMLLPMSNTLISTVKEFRSGSQVPDSDTSAELAGEGSSLLGDGREASAPGGFGNYVEAPPLMSARTWKILVLVTSLVLFFPFILVCVMYFPSNWEYFIPGDLRAFALECYYEDSEGYSLGDAIRFKVGGACLKFWPDLQIFYFAIYATAVVALGAVHSRELRVLLHSRPKFLLGFTLGESFVVTLFTLMLFFEFIYWYVIRDVWNGAKQSSMLVSERLARTAGQLANMVMGLLLFPISRNNMWTYCFGLGWESMLWFHQLLGDIFLAIIVVHIVSWCVYYDNAGLLWFKELMYDRAYHQDNFTINLQTWIVIPFFVTHGVLTMSYIRRNYFEVFYYAHHLYMALFISTIWHANSAWYYLLPGLALWFLDRILRTMNAYGSVKVLKCEALSNDGADVTMLSYVVKPLSFPTSFNFDAGYAPLAMSVGQYAYINIPELSGAEWHPFSISSAPGDASTTHHIKDMGPGTWTNQLYTLVRSEPKGLTVSVDGPYGSPFSTEGYSKILLVAGGIGITAAHSIFKGLLKQAASLPPGLISVELTWVMKDANMIGMFKETFEELGEKGGYDGRFSASFYVTGKAEAPYSFQKGRPDIRQKVNELAMYGMDALVWHCGPKILGDSCLEAAMDCGVDFKNDSFEL
jgi:predicted ferric reductase